MRTGTTPEPCSLLWTTGICEILYDYKEYSRTINLAANSHPDDPIVLAQLMRQEETIFAFWTVEYEPVALHNMATRGDWLEKLGLTNDDVVTMDDWFNMLKGFQTEVGIESPYLLYSTLDAHGGFSCFDTHCAVSLTSIAYPVIENGAVAFSNTREEDKNFLTMINQWWNEGFITPLWQSAIGNANVTEQIYNGEIGVIGMVPGEAGDYEDLATDPNAEWVPLHKPVLEEGQVFHLGDQRSWISYGSWFINADCANIPLAATWCDYFYSEEGIFFSNYGVEGVSFEYDEDGKPMLTEFITENPGGLSWAIMSYAMCEIIDGGVSIRNRSYAYPGGERIAGFHTYWIDPDYYRYDASMEWPSAVTFTNEENSTISQYANDITTYISEN
jgi:putative aldouronate transport system substrate-binding protein